MIRKGEYSLMVDRGGLEDSQGLILRERMQTISMNLISAISLVSSQSSSVEAEELVVQSAVGTSRLMLRFHSMMQYSGPNERFCSLSLQPVYLVRALEQKKEARC